MNIFSGYELLWLCFVYSFLGWVGGHLIEKAFKERWWDYSGVK